ncbi:MAG: hypothetical protein JXA78_08105 [Anaerolineales bacterium]|nr:hypothetical protein [Anaerolineales bacterium]
MNFHHAIVRAPGKDFAQGITSAGLGPPDYDRMLAQHAAYVQALETLGLQVLRLDPLEGFPDAYFVEDVAVVTPELAVITRPGAPARRGEENTMQPVLAAHKETARIRPPGTLDGGDVLIVERQVFIGLSGRTNREGAKQLGSYLGEHGYTWTAVQVGAGLHLKSGVNYVGKNTLLASEEFAGMGVFDGYDKIVVEADEAYAANTLLINGRLIMPQGFARTRAQLARLGFEVIELDVSEARKMDGGLTCMSIRF